jgi:hypothetical protein
VTARIANRDAAHRDATTKTRCGAARRSRFKRSTRDARFERANSRRAIRAREFVIIDRVVGARIMDVSMDARARATRERAPRRRRRRRGSIRTTARARAGRRARRGGCWRAF